MSRALKFFCRLVGIIILIAILYQVDWQLLKIFLKKVQLKYFLFAIPFFLFTNVAKSLRWFYILRTQDIRLSVFRTYVLYSAGAFWGSVTPGKIGEATKIFYLSEKGISNAKAIFSVITDKLADIVFLIVVTTIAFPVVFNHHLLFLWGVGGIFAFILLYKKASLFLKIKQSIFLLISHKYMHKLKIVWEQTISEINRFSLKNLLVLMVITTFAWVINISPLYMFGRDLDLKVSPLILLTGIILSFFISMLPISINGIGTRDAFFILFFKQSGIIKEQAILFSFMYIYMNIVVIISCYALYLFKDVNGFSKRT